MFDFFDALTMIGGLCLFLFGMNVMGQALERRAGNGLKNILGKLTSGKIAGFFTGLAVTAVIQSSSATTVMVVGFVNSGIMSLSQSINVIIGANVGTTVTSWILSLTGIESSNFFISLLKPTSFTPLLAVIGIILYMFCKGAKKKDTGMILLGFATLMFGMDTMSGAVKGLADVPAFQNLFLLFENPILGMLAGAILTAIIQSSSASVGILQALAVTGKISYGAAIPIIMGQNIGTCITALLSSVGANKNARRASLVHLIFNLFGAIVGVLIFYLIDLLISPALFGDTATVFGIAISHTLFNVLCTALMLPASKLLEKVAYIIIPETKTPEKVSELDERLYKTPALAIERSKSVSITMANVAVQSFKDGISIINKYTDDKAERIRELEDQTDHYEDILSNYLVQLSTRRISAEDSTEAAKILKIIGDFERISDHAVNLVESAEELHQKQIILSPNASKELQVILDAVNEALDIALKAYQNDDAKLACQLEPLEEIIDGLKEKIRSRHIERLQNGECTIEAGFVLSDILTGLERTSDHCSNICACIIDMADNKMNLHESMRSLIKNEDFHLKYEEYATKYFI